MKSFFLGAVQGLTEFLPVSSDGHLYFFERFLAISANPLAFFVFLHIATLLVIVFFFRNSIIAAISSKKTVINIFAASLVTCLLALAIKVFLESFFQNRYLISACFLINGMVLISIKGRGENKTIFDMDLKDAFIVGFIQAFAVLPAISRSGITMAILIRRGFAPKEAFTFSFVMAIPVILAAFIFELKDLAGQPIPAGDLFYGFTAAFFFGILALAILKKLVINLNFRYLGYYCLGLSALNLFF